MSNNNSWARCTGDSYTLCPVWVLDISEALTSEIKNVQCYYIFLAHWTKIHWHLDLYSLHIVHSTLHFKPTAQNKSKSLRFFMSFSMVPGVHHQCLLQKLSKAFWSALSKELVKKLNIFFGERAYMTEYSPICHTPLLQLPSWHIAVFILSYA